MEKIIAVIQARMGSTRLPGKVLANIEGKPLIWHIYNRLQKISTISEIIISLTLFLFLSDFKLKIDLFSFEKFS